MKYILHDVLICYDAWLCWWYVQGRLEAETGPPNLGDLFSSFQALMAASLEDQLAFDSASAAFGVITQVAAATPSPDVTMTLANTVICVCERACAASPADSPFLFWALYRLLE